jgi:Potential Queuosine, Q, salvage protein family
VPLVDDTRRACAWVAGRARSVRIREEAVEPYARALELPTGDATLDPELHLVFGPLETRAAFFLTLDAVNFGSGWFPTLRKRPGLSGYATLAASLRERFVNRGPWSARQLGSIEHAEVAAVTGQDPGHELVRLWTDSLRALGQRVAAEHAGDWLDVVASAGGSAVGMVEVLADFASFEGDVSNYDGRPVPFYKRAQIAAADLHLGGVVEFGDLNRLTLFADNLVPHVLRLDGVLEFAPALVRRIDAGQPLEHGSPEEVEMRACAVQAAELMVAARGDASAQAIDHVLWNRGADARYKSHPRPRARTTAY